jgi:glycerol kinase
MNTGKTLRRSHHRLLSTIAWTEANGETTYALEGSAFMAGATIQWLRDGLKMISSSSEIEDLANEVKSTEGVMLVPAFAGLGAPHWDPNARAVISGLTRGSTRAHIARAALEGIALQNADILQAMEKDLGSELTVLKVDGGACKNNLLMQMQSDFLGRELKRPVFTETTSLGAVFAAGIGAGIWKSLHEIEKVWKLEREFKPQVKADERTEKLKEWSKALDRAKL